MENKPSWKTLLHKKDAQEAASDGVRILGASPRFFLLTNVFVLIVIMLVFLIFTPSKYADLQTRYYLIRILFFVCVVPSLAGGFCVLFSKCAKEKDLTPYLLIALAIIAAVFPMLINNFLYHDNLWGFSINPSASQVLLGVGLGRPFFGLLHSLFAGVGFSRSYILRIFTTIITILFSFLCG